MEKLSGCAIDLDGFMDSYLYVVRFQLNAVIDMVAIYLICSRGK